MNCVVCQGQLNGVAVRIDSSSCLSHLCHDECLERWSHSWRKNLGDQEPNREGFQCPVCQATSVTYVSTVEGHLGGRLKWSQISFEKPHLPPGAVSAGLEWGLEIFVARGRIRNELVPGKWVPSKRHSYFSWGGEETKIAECEILSLDPEDHGPNDPDPDPEASQDNLLKWVPAANGEVPPNSVVGGHTSYGEALYVGRTLPFGNDQSYICGKVHASHKLLYIPFMGKELQQRAYEVLVYQPPTE